AEQPVEGKLPGLPSVGRAARTTHQRRMVEDDEVLIDVIKLGYRRKVVLAGGDAADLFPGHKLRHLESETGKIVSDRVFDSGAVASDVVEGRVDGDETKLAFVDIVAIDPEVAVLRQHQMRGELMKVANVPGVVGFGIEFGA